MIATLVCLYMLVASVQLSLLYTHLHVHAASQRHNNKDRCMKDNARMKDAWRLLYNYILPLTLLQGFERVVQGLHVRGCWWPNINFIFWPHCYDRHVVSFLFSCCWGPLHRGVSEGPLGRVWPSLPHLVSTVWNSPGNCFGTPNSTQLYNN